MSHVKIAVCIRGSIVQNKLIGVAQMVALPLIQTGETCLNNNVEIKVKLKDYFICFTSLICRAIWERFAAVNLGGNLVRGRLIVSVYLTRFSGTTEDEYRPALLPSSGKDRRLKRRWTFRNIFRVPDANKKSNRNS